MCVCVWGGGGGGEGSRPPTPGVQPPLPPAQLFSLFFFRVPPPKIQIFCSRPCDTPPPPPFFVKSSLPPTPLSPLPPNSLSSPTKRPPGEKRPEMISKAWFPTTHYQVSSRAVCSQGIPQNTFDDKSILIQVMSSGQTLNLLMGWWHQDPVNQHLKHWLVQASVNILL